jgi:hypothetical protein
MQKMTAVAPYYIAKYVDWYMTPKEERCSWDELCRCDENYRVRTKTDGVVAVTETNKTEEFCRTNWLTRPDTQKAIQIYLRGMKNYNIMLIHNKMMEKALAGDVNAAKYIDQFYNSAFFDDKDDEIDDFLSSVNIPALKKVKGDK